jgi:hypothetical protein
MGKRCQEPHCLEIVPDHLFDSHQDQHIAERLAAEEFEQHRNEQNADAQLARAIANNEESEAFSAGGEDDDFQLALALNREFRNEEEQRSFRQVQV